jgi:formylglycine-generating enzyme required for sulfatase activity
MKNRFIALFCIYITLTSIGCYKQPARSVYYPGRQEVFTAQGISFQMIFVPAKRFFTDTDDKETASVKNSFWIGETEVTYELWKTVWSWATSKGGYDFANPGIPGDGMGRSNQHPATTLNWRDTIVWCNALTEWLNVKNGTRYSCVYNAGMSPIRDARGNFARYTDTVVPDSGATGFRIPTTDEWELAARYIEDKNNDGDIKDAGEYYPGIFASGATASILNVEETAKVAVFFSNSTQPVKSKAANALGIYDMCGNVDEWCFGWYPGFKSKARLSRGGNWLSSADSVALGLMLRQDPYTENFFIGFRIARVR